MDLLNGSLGAFDIEPIGGGNQGKKACFIYKCGADLVLIANLVRGFDYQVTQLEEGRALDGSFFGRAFTSMPWQDALTQKSEWMSNCIPLVLAGVEEKAKKEEALEDRREADRRAAFASRKPIVKPARITSPADLVQYDQREVGR